MKPIFILLFLCLAILSSGSIHLPPRQTKTPGDIVYIVGETGNNIIWAFEAHESDDNPTTYSVVVDGSPVSGHTNADWQDNVDIVVNVDGLDACNYLYTITVNDNGVDTNRAAPAVDTVTVSVRDLDNNIVTDCDPEQSSSPASLSSSSPSSVQSSTPSSTEDPAFAPLVLIPTFIIVFMLRKFRNNN